MSHHHKEPGEGCGGADDFDCGWSMTSLLSRLALREVRPSATIVDFPDLSGRAVGLSRRRQQPRTADPRSQSAAGNT
ncbi:hypothetical protein [Paracoccus denitrificans]|jgi:hypothetical protein|nr:hypothetical protein [Paracoccus denitrificans]MBB4629588.1 hypothetical protein [Paracoccus denitrificans]MCU7430984.1 hypothetical protein [Paracoccus denitrificans]QAR27925.1 hypothetical protein EO213_16350 [Paracoccus denitrificans]UPV97639.1 hypothetical protein M0K93_16415 [Paracoccus denitrificans]WQO35553.1 hypothetical protein U0005_22300 [Paracoccus denitrificans]